MCGCFSPRDESHRMIIAKSRGRLIAKDFHSSGHTFRRLFTAPVARLLASVSSVGTWTAVRPLASYFQKRLDPGTDSRVYNQNVVQKPYLRSGMLASLTGISPDTLRHYERLKLLALPRRSSGNYRLYPPEAVDRVRLIRRALAIGFSLRELAKILKVRDEGGSPCRQVKRLLEEKLFKMDKQIGDLMAMRDHLRTVLADWDKQLARTFKGSPARLLDTLIVSEHRANPVRLKRRAI